ncbi:ParA family protein [Sneathiella aquimaris]|uniref:ParA family protein n=1 Tax=Sneathiella aquimaris TaxID=2599305 RepID=UPI002260F314|nr:ParA family protein [Sneathiella aquimaris]
MVSFVASKGGAGKSTLAIQCAVHASQNGLNVLILDMDSQGSVRDWYDQRLQTISEFSEQHHSRLHVQPVQLGELVETVERARASGIDVLVIDTAGDDRLGTASVVGVSDQVLVPCRPTMRDLKGAIQTFQMVSRQQKSFAFILNQTPPQTAAKGGRVREAAQVLLQMGTLCPVPVVARVDYQDADGLGLGVTEFNPSGKAASDIRALWAWVENRK